MSTILNTVDNYVNYVSINIQQNGFLCSRNMDNNKSANDDYGPVSIDADTTIKLTAGLVISDKVAVIAVLPTATPVTTPSAGIVATEISEMVHFTRSVMFWLWLSILCAVCHQCDSAYLNITWNMLNH
jgi:hypothetical protein